MNRQTQPRSTIGCLLTLMLSVGMGACGPQAGDAAFSDIALPTFSKDRVAQEAPVEVRRLLSSSTTLNEQSGPSGLGTVVPSESSPSRDWSIHSMSPSPDGRYLTDVNWLDWAGDVSVVDLETGEERSITPDGMSGESCATTCYAERSVFSPNGSRIAYTWSNGSDRDNRWEVRSIGVDGSNVRIHFPAEYGSYLWVLDWSSDGRYLLIKRLLWDETRTTGGHIATIDVNTHEYRVLKTMDWFPRGSSFFSPDGRFVAFSLRSDPNSRERDIFLVSTDGSHEEALIQTPDQERLLGWLPDGSGILFHRTADDSRAIWKLPVQDGRPSGPPELVKDDVWEMTGLGFSDDAYFYGVTASRPGVHTASFDFETGRVLEPLAPLAELSGSENASPAWSPDGTRIAYVESGGNDGSRIIIRSVTGELRQDLTVALDLGIGPDNFSAWTEQGLIFRGTDRGGRSGLHLISLETGEVSHLGPPGALRREAYTVSEDGSSIFVAPYSGGPIIEHDIATGAERTLVEGDAYAQVTFPDDPAAHATRASVSPDGDQIAYLVSRKAGSSNWEAIEIFSRSTGESRVIQKGFSSVRRGSTLTWSRDSRHLFFFAVPEGGEVRHLIQVSVADGSVRNLSATPGRIHAISVSPDGRHIAMFTGVLGEEIWRMTFNGGG